MNFEKLTHSVNSMGIEGSFRNYLSKKEEATTETSSKSMYRLYNPNSGEHFYTASASERDVLARVGWVYEGIGW